MSSTRRAKKEGGFRQERFASSAKLAKGLRGNLIAKRCAALKSPVHSQLVYFLHEVSLRHIWGGHYSCNLFPCWPWASPGAFTETSFERVARELVTLWPDRVHKNPANVQASIAAFLPRFCLDPSIDPESANVSGFGDIFQTLVEYRAKFETGIMGRIAATQIRETIFEALDFALSQRGFVLIEGAYRSGKSYCSQAWCLSHLGSARYVQLTSAGDDAAFYREIARAIGVACSLQMKTAQMRVRIEETLRSQRLLLCIDEADWIWSQAVRMRAAPERVNWLMTALVNHGIPVALIGSRNFSRLLRNTEKHCPVWGSEQFHGRIRLRKELSDGLSQADLFAIARLLLPDADEPTLMLLVGYALESKGRVAALETAASRARFFAEQQNRGVSFEDVRAAMREAGYKFDSGESRPAAAQVAAVLRKAAAPILMVSARSGRRTAVPGDRTAKQSRTPREGLAEHVGTLRPG